MQGLNLPARISMTYLIFLGKAAAGSKLLGDLEQLLFPVAALAD